MERRPGRLISWPLGRSIWLIALTLLVLLTPAVASASERVPVETSSTPRSDAAVGSGSITVLQTSGRSDFPKAITFGLQVKSTAQISSIRIIYRVGDDPVTSIARVSFAPGYRVDTSYHIDLGHEYYPPGVTIHYQWKIQDQSGAELTTSRADLKVTDPRFLWHERTEGPITVHWYQGDDRFGDAALGAANQALQVAGTTVGVTMTQPVQIYLYGDQNDFRSALGRGADQWVGGQTFPIYRVVLLYAPPTDVLNVQRSIGHEMTHIAMDSTADEGIGTLPSWLSEGLAMVAEGPLDPPFQQALAEAVRAHHLLSIQSVSGNFPEDPQEATLAYAESQSLVSYFLQTYGRAKLAVLIRAFRSGATIDEAFQQSTGLSSAEFQRSWQASLERQLGIRPAASPTAPTSPEQRSPISTLLAPITFIVAIIESIIRLLQTAKG